jgi:hypothetical protein
MKPEENSQCCGHERIRSAAGDRWLTPVILATQEAEIRRITVESQPGFSLSGKKTSQKNGWWSGSR